MSEIKKNETWNILFPSSLKYRLQQLAYKKGISGARLVREACEKLLTEEDFRAERERRKSRRI